MLTRGLLVVVFALWPMLLVECFELKIAAGRTPAESLRWKSSGGSIPVTLHANGSADLPFSSVEEAVSQSLYTWQSVAGQSLGLVYEGTTDAEASAGDRRNTVQWVEQDWTYSKYTLAVTRYAYFADDPFTLVEADILMNGSDYRWGVNRDVNSNILDTRQVLTHEIGHLLGLAHTGVFNAQMHPYLPNRVQYELSLDDSAGMLYLYGQTVNNFRLVTPVKRAGYLERLYERGLPLPIFRWKSGPVADYLLEFSASKGFGKTVVFSAGPNLYFVLTPVQERRLLRLAKDGKVYWRVRSGLQVTHPRMLRFVKSA